MEDELVSIDTILCDCYQEEKPKTWQDHAKEWLIILGIALGATIIIGLAAVGALDILLSALIGLP